MNTSDRSVPDRFDNDDIDDDLTPGQIERLAKRIHFNYLYKVGAKRNAAGEPRLASTSWENLRPEDREQNLDQARDIPRKLRAVNMKLVPASRDQQVDFTPAEIEILAEMEHDRWARQKQSQGYTFGKALRDSPPRTHPDLIPYKELASEIQDYDRNMIRDLLPFLRDVGLGVARTYRS